MNVDETMDNYVINIKTVQTGAFRVLVEALKEILVDCNLTIDETGIKLIATDTSHNVLIHLKLLAGNFEFFHCKAKTIIGINMTNLFKLIKTMGNNETLTLFIESCNSNKLGIQINNQDKNTQTVYKLNLLDISEEDIQIPAASFETELTLPSNDFQKLIRDMTSIGENVEIKSTGSTLVLNCMGDFASQETLLCETQNGLSYSSGNTNPEKTIQGIFSLKYLLLFTKCTNLCNLIHLYIKNDYPLVISYNVANLGIIKLCLAPNTE